MRDLSHKLFSAALISVLAIPLSSCAQTQGNMPNAAHAQPLEVNLPVLTDESFARPEKSQDQQMDKRNTVPVGYETHIILGDESDRPIADKILKLYEVFATNPTGETMEEFMSDRYIQHSTGVPNGRNPIAMLFASSVAQYDVKIDVHKVIVVGPWAMAHVNFRNVDNAEPDDLGTAAVDMYFFGPDGRIEEHWDVLQQVPTHSANANGMFVKLYEGE
ncbi:MAG: nuclear transport factor 2 family protein [Pseudomonadota bacterium]